MAKKQVVLTGVALLAAIGAAMGSEPGYLFITQDQANSVDAGDISVNPAITEGDKAAAILTDAGKAKVAEAQTKPEAAKANVVSGLEGFEIPKGRAKRGNALYPFDSLEVGGSFFVEGEDKVKTLSSTASKLQRETYGEPIVDAEGNAVMEEYKAKGETKQRPKIAFTREFTVRAVKAGVKYGAWTAPADGGVVVRTA